MRRHSYRDWCVASVFAIVAHQAAQAQTVDAVGQGPAATASETPSPAETRSEPQDISQGQDIVVTATRREESLSRVPISVAAINQEALDQRGIRQVDDLARITPGVNFSRTGGAGNQTRVSIRGIESTVGASTTGIYIDDTPIQTRTAGFTSSNAFPAIFDLSRVEVLRGPQGTLFGSGSEGGTIRFISPNPGLTEYSSYVRAELGFTQNGAPSYELGSALGGPILTDQLGFRASTYYRRDGGWVDRVDPASGRLLDRDMNSTETIAGRLAFTLRPVSDLTITPAIFFQDIDTNGNGRLWEALSDPGDGKFRNGDRLRASSSDRFFLPSLKIDYDLGPVGLHSNTAYFDRKTLAFPDYTQFVRAVTTRQPYPLIPGEYTVSIFADSQKAFTQEVRLEGEVPAGLNWTVGVFYSNSKQTSSQVTPSPFFPQIVQDTFGVDYLKVFGVPLGENDSVYTDRQRTTDEQIAGFAQLEYAITDRLKATAGARYSKVRFKFESKNEGPFAGISQASGSQTENPFTPKFGLSFQADPRNLFYASAAKGFRPGGSQRRPGNSCAADLGALGISTPPTTYNSDSVWSYEVGAKSRFLGGALGVSSSAFLIDWNDIQQSVRLPICGQTLITNLGKARVKGFDIAIDVDVGRLSLNATAGYTDATYSQTLTSGPALVAAEGDAISTISPWTATATANYRFDVLDRNGYARIDYDFRSRAPKPNGSIFGIDPILFRRPESHVVNGRLGVSLDSVDVSLFVQNLFNNSTVQARSRDSVSSPLFYSNTLRPRTFGVTISLRQ